MSAVYIAIAIAAALLGADRVLKYLSRTGKLRLESKYLRLTHLENRGFFLGLGQKHEKLLRWLPMGRLSTSVMPSAMATATFTVSMPFCTIMPLKPKMK